MRSKLSIFLKMAPILCVLFFSTSKTFSGQEGHGGQTVDIDGHLVLRDFVDSTNCEWIRAEDFVVNVNFTVLPEILSSIEKIHWYFADAISREIHEGELAVCQTWGELKKIPEDSDDVTIVELDTKQAAVRINDMIFIDMPLFEELDADSKAYLFLHEIMHSFVPLHTPRRNGKLRSMISTIRKNQVVPMSKEHFGLQIKMNSIDMPTTDVPLEPYKETVFFLLDDTKKAEERAPLAFQLPDGIIEILSNKDKKNIHSLQALAQNQYGKIIIAWKNAYAPGDEFLLYMAVRQGDLKRVQQLAQNPKLKFNLAIDNKNSLLLTAVNHKYFDIVQWLIENKASELVHKEDVLRWTYHQNNYDLFKLLAPHVDFNDVNSRSQYSYYYYHPMFFCAVEDGRLEYLKLILKFGKNLPINYKKDVYASSPPHGYTDDYTALHIAAEQGNVEMVKELIRYPGIDPFMEAKRGSWLFTDSLTPRDLAEEKGYEEIEKILEEFEDSLDE